ncbi:MAG: alpha/beta hydrolase-fold protein [Dehalococcoidia bacterium]
MRNVTLVRGMSLTAMAGGLFTGALLYLSRRWVVPPRVLLGAPEGGAAREVTFPSADGIPLYGWYLHAGVHAPALALCHGYQRCIEETLSLGYSYTGAASTCCCSTSGLRRQWRALHQHRLLRAARSARRHRLAARAARPAHAVGVLGISMGGSVALTAAADCPEVRAVVSDSAFATLRGAIAHRFARLRFPSLQLHYLRCGRRVAMPRPRR